MNRKGDNGAGWGYDLIEMASNAKRHPQTDQSSLPEEEFKPRTPLGRRLWELRKRIIASGQPLLDWDDLEREIAERRGGVSERDL
ncbi:MAG: hypothetical protein ACREMY_23980 [bacterium]